MIRDRRTQITRWQTRPAYTKQDIDDRERAIAHLGREIAHLLRRLDNPHLW